MRTYLAYSLLLLLAVCLVVFARLRLKARVLSEAAVPTWFWLAFGALAFGMTLLLGTSTEPQARDLFVDFTKAYYPAGQAAIQHPADLYARSDDDLTYVNIPLVALLFSPFAALNVSTAATVMTVIGVLATIATAYYCIRLTGVTGWQRLLLIGLFAVNGPLFYNLRIGNTSQYTLLLLIAALFSLRQKREVLAGGLLAIAGIIKVPLLLFGAYYCLRGRWRVVAGLVGGLVVIGLASLLVFGPELHVTWYQQCIQPFAGKPLSAFNVQSVDGFLARSLLGGGLRNWLPMQVDWTYKLVRYVLVALLVGSAIWIGWRSRPPATTEAENLEFAIVLCLALTISPISWTHYYLMMMLPLALYVGNQLAIPLAKGWLWGMAISALLLSLPTVNLNLEHPLFKLLISHYLFGGLLLLTVLLVARWQTSKLPRLSDHDAKQFA